MNIKCFSDLEKWMQGVVAKVKVATGTGDAVCLTLRAWHFGAGGKEVCGHVWIAEGSHHLAFRNYQELSSIVYSRANLRSLLKPPILYRKFEL